MTKNENDEKKKKKTKTKNDKKSTKNNHKDKTRQDNNSVESRYDAREKTKKSLCLKLLKKSRPTESEHHTLHGSAGPCKHGYHGIMDDVASSMGTSRWTHVDAWWVLRSKKKKEKSSHRHALCKFTAPVIRRCMRRRRCLARKWRYKRWRPRHDGTRWSTRQEVIFVDSLFPR